MQLGVTVPNLTLPSAPSYFKVPIVYVEPLLANINALMLDNASEEMRMGVLLNAVAMDPDNNIVATAPVALVNFPPPSNLGVVIARPM